MEVAPRPGHPAAHGGHPVPTAHHTQGCAGKGCWAGLRRAAPINKIPLQPPLCEAGACHPSSEVGCLPRQMARFLPRPPPPAQHRAGPPPLDPAGWRWEAPTGLRGVKLAVFLSPCPPRGVQSASPGPQAPHPAAPSLSLQVRMLSALADLWVALCPLWRPAVLPATITTPPDQTLKESPASLLGPQGSRGLKL